MVLPQNTRHSRICPDSNKLESFQILQGAPATTCKRDDLRGISRRSHFYSTGGWSGGAKVLSKLSVLGRPTIWINVGQGPIALAVGAGGGCLDIFTLIYPFSPLSPSLWETARYRLKYCLKGPLKPKQPTKIYSTDTDRTADLALMDSTSLTSCSTKTSPPPEMELPAFYQQTFWHTVCAPAWYQKPSIFSAALKESNIDLVSFRAR